MDTVAGFKNKKKGGSLGVLAPFLFSVSPVKNLTAHATHNVYIYQQ